MSKKWLSIRIEGSECTAEVKHQDIITDSEGVVHTVTCSVPVELPADVRAKLGAIITDCNTTAALTKGKVKHANAVEELIEKRPLLEKASLVLNKS